MIQGYKPGKGLTQSQKHKIKEILKNQCLKKQDDNHCLCLPIPGYNKNVYRIWRDFPWESWKCNCQYYVTTQRPCSHISALQEYLKEWGKDGQKRLF